MRYFKLTIEYDGSDFSGWQVQPDRRTVQGELYRAFGELSRGEIKITGAGRTDAGVHATGQVASVRVETDLSAGAIHRAVAAKLPADILVKQTEEVPPAFNARFDARSRRYDYIFMMKETSLWRGRFLPVGSGIDVHGMRKETRGLVGLHDFTPFASSGGPSGSKRCRIIRAELIEARPLLILSVTADRFLYNMMRSIAGTILRVGRGKGPGIKEILESGNRAEAGPTLPPHALYLVEVTY
jgi:tRNA pseudouridine38-40 synthase